MKFIRIIMGEEEYVYINVKDIKTFVQIDKKKYDIYLFSGKIYYIENVIPEKYISQFDFENFLESDVVLLNNLWQERLMASDLT